MKSSTVKNAIVVLMVLGMWEGGKLIHSHYGIHDASGAISMVKTVPLDVYHYVYGTMASHIGNMWTQILLVLILALQALTGLFWILVINEESEYKREPSLIPYLKYETKSHGFSVGLMLLVLWSLFPLLGICFVGSALKALVWLFSFKIIKPSHDRRSDYDSSTE